MKKTPEMSAQGKKALETLREAVREAVAEHRRAGVPIVVRTEKPSGRQRSALIREDTERYMTKTRRKVDQ
ncbi:MAG: hypothetical protein M5U15_12370 [Kiritimatiellae bacterium]|nr:hypothetical protein [Kiritimatiellia bacterium]